MLPVPIAMVTGSIFRSIQLVLLTIQVSALRIPNLVNSGTTLPTQMEDMGSEFSIN